MLNRNQKDLTPRTPSSPSFTRCPPFRTLPWKAFEVLGLLAAILFVLAPLFPTIGPQSPNKTVIAKNDVVQIVTAIKNFYIEYGRFPQIIENGFSETAEANAQLMRILCALDTTENPREIRFLEVPEARKKRGVFRSGIDPNNGAWKDPWGSFYRIRITTDFNSVASPYSSEDAIPTSCIAWSVGKDRTQDNRDAPTTSFDDVASWQ